MSAEGAHAARTIGHALAALGIVPKFVLTSPARRARETLACLGLPQSLPAIASPEHLYLADAAAIRRELRKVPGTVRSVLVIGHNPGLSELARYLLAPGEESRAGAQLKEGLPTAALVELAVDEPWSDLGKGNARLIRLLTPHGSRGAVTLATIAAASSP